MPALEATQYLPESRDLRDVFDITAKTHFTIGKTPKEIRNAPLEKVMKATSDLVATAVGYFANRGHSEYAQIAGTSTWNMMEHEKVLIFYTLNMHEELIKHYGIDPRIVSQRVVYGEPVFIDIQLPMGNHLIDGASILFPPEFTARAMSQPVEALGTMAYFISEINDIANHRVQIDETFIMPRAKAFQSDFLHFAQEQITGLQLSAVARNAMNTYPHGMASLPAEMRYTPRVMGTAGDNFALN
jgi:hypothetical protein